MGEPDSALAAFQQVTDLPAPSWEGADVSLPLAYQRAGEILEARGDKAKAVEYYGRLVALWENADAELQPRVQELKRRIGLLAGEPGGP
jgi:tetratricopeptide (TPR) repeat protein